ncbi:MAG: pullulanase [Mycobacterium sp.]
MEFCWSIDGTASMWRADFDTDLDGDGILDAVKVDLDADGLLDDALADFDSDGVADHAVLDFAAADPEHFGDDGTGTWSVPVDRAGQLRWFGLDGVERPPGALVDFDGDGAVDDTLFDSDGDGLADRVLCAEEGGVTGFVDVDADGRWDVTLIDSDGDGAADSATEL